MGARALQRATGGMLPRLIGIVRDELPRKKVGVTVGLLSAILGVEAGTGIVAAGPIVENLSWHRLFWLPLMLVRTARVISVSVSRCQRPGCSWFTVLMTIVFGPLAGLLDLRNGLKVSMVLGASLVPAGS